jgi:hypothetical protein
MEITCTIKIDKYIRWIVFKKGEIMKRKILLISIICVIFLSACGPSGNDKAQKNTSEKSGSSESVILPTTPPEPSALPEPTEFICPIQEKQHQEWETILCEEFNDNSYQWDEGLDPQFGTNSELKNGIYSIDYNSENTSGYTTGFSLAIPFIESQDFVLNILGEMDSNFKQCTWGVMFNGFYDTGISFEIDNQGSFYLTDNNISGNYIGNAETGAHSAIKWDQPNQITIVADGGSLLFMVNGELLTSYEYDYSDNNVISLSLWAAEGVNVTYEFDHILVREK